MTNVALVSKAMGITLARDGLINTTETNSGVPNLGLSGTSLKLKGFYDTTLKPKLLDSLQVGGADGNELSSSDGFQSYHYSYVGWKYFEVMASLESGDNGGCPSASSGSGIAFMAGNYTETWGITSIIPNPTTWNSTTPDSTGLRSLAGTDVVSECDSEGTDTSGNGGSGNNSGSTNTSSGSSCIFDSSHFDSCVFN